MEDGPAASIDHSIIFNGWRDLALWDDDVFLGMQGMNVAITDSCISDWENNLLAEYIEREKTPIDSAMMVGAFSQQWVFALYEAMRVWRDRIYNLRKWFAASAIDTMIGNLKSEDDEFHVLTGIRRRQLEQYRDDEAFRKRIEDEWTIFEPVYRKIELVRMNLAKHSAPGKDSMLTRAPGYGRIDMTCGSIYYAVVDRDGNNYLVSRRELADDLRSAFGRLAPAMVAPPPTPPAASKKAKRKSK
jgi:hypothetical protein